MSVAWRVRTRLFLHDFKSSDYDLKKTKLYIPTLWEYRDESMCNSRFPAFQYPAWWSNKQYFAVMILVVQNSLPMAGSVQAYCVATSDFRWKRALCKLHSSASFTSDRSRNSYSWNTSHQYNECLPPQSNPHQILHVRKKALWTHIPLTTRRLKLWGCRGSFG